MKNTIKILTALVLLSLSSLMKSQVANPYGMQNNLGCQVEFEITEYDANCIVVAGPTSITLTSGSNISWALNAATYDVSVQVLNVNGPSCSVTQSNFVQTNTSGNCSGSPTSSNLSGPSCACGISSVILTMIDVTIN